MNDPFRNYDNWKLATPPWYDDEHHPECPCSEDALPVWSQCDGVGECVCYEKTPWGLARRYFGELYDFLKFGQIICQPIMAPDCRCEEISVDDDASECDAAEARMESRREMEDN